MTTKPDINPIYLEMLDEHYGKKKPVETTLPTPEKYILSCCGPIELNVRGGYYVCWSCGLIKDNQYIVQEEEPEKTRFSCGGNQLSFGGNSSYMYKKYRSYKPLTHFREHIRMYLGQRFKEIPVELINDLRKFSTINVNDRHAYSYVKDAMKSIRHNVYSVQVWNYESRMLETKHYKTPKFYKDIFAIIYTLGGQQPKIKCIEEIVQTYKNLQFVFMKVRDEQNRHNMPSHFMVLDILLRMYGHIPFYELPYLKDYNSRHQAMKILQHLHQDVQQNLGIN